MKLAISVLNMAKQMPQHLQVENKAVISAAFREVYHSSMPQKEFCELMTGVMYTAEMAFVARSPNPFVDDGYQHAMASGGDIRIRDGIKGNPNRYADAAVGSERLAKMEAAGGSPAQTGRLA